MPQIAADKLDAIELEDTVSSAFCPVLEPEDDVLIGKGKDPGVADGGSGDIGAQVFDGAGSGAAGLDVNTPVHGPDCGISFKVEAVKLNAESLLERVAQRRDGDKKARALDLAKGVI